MIFFAPEIVQYEKEPLHNELGFWELPTDPFPNPTFFPKWEVSVNVYLGEG